MKREMRTLLVGFALATGACSSIMPLPLVFGPRPVETACATASARISFDFEAASFSRCVIHGDREFSVLVTPEHMPPINPSPWYAFRYDAKPGDDLRVHIRYLGGSHRYSPILQGENGMSALQFEASASGDTASIALPAGKGTVSAQELIDITHYRKLLGRWARVRDAKRFIIGRSHDRRKIEAVRIGRADAPQLVVLLGRQPDCRDGRCRSAAA
jgi:hypothetical protein